MKLEDWWLDRPLENLKDDFVGLHVIGTSREEAEKFIKEQFEGDGSKKENYKNPDEYWTGAFHYGKCELKDLMDLIYGKKEGKCKDSQ